MSTRSTVYNRIVDTTVLERCNRANLDLQSEFMEYLRTVDKADSTIAQYDNDIKIFWVWNKENNDDKGFCKITKRDFLQFQNYALYEWKWSPCRLLRVKSTISSLSKYVENYLDEEDEYSSFKPNIRKIESPCRRTVREKTIITDDEVAMVLGKLVSQRKYCEACVFALASYSGARKSELLRFKVSYFDDKNIIPGTSLYMTPEPIKTKGRGTKGKMLVKYTLTDFRPYLDLWMMERARNNVTDNEYILCNLKSGEVMSGDAMYKISETITEYLGRPFYFHALRHQLCSRLHRMGLPDNVIQAYFGWENADMVQRYDDNDQSEILKRYFTVG